jgi:predicted PurR-regulated permease PerM
VTADERAGSAEGAGPPAGAERRRVERRVNQRVADLTVPELRRIVVTSLLFGAVLVLFLWMVRDVIIAGILGVVIGAYLRPLYARLLRVFPGKRSAGFATLVLAIAPVLGLLLYSYLEIRDVAAYVATHQEPIAARLNEALSRLPFVAGRVTPDSIRAWVLRASNYGARIPLAVKEAVVEFSVAAAVFLFTAFYILVDSPKVVAWLRAKVPPRYDQLSRSLEANVSGVLYGTIYATLLTQTVKSAVIFLMNVAFGVPLAAVLAILSFIIGFFPIVGSWTVYAPVAAWLLIFRGATASALAVLMIGFFVNTLFLTNYVRPKLAAERSGVLDFYWMFLGLVTGVYTFGLAGVLLGPILIGLLKAILDTFTAGATWQLIEHGDDATAIDGTA